MSKLQIQPVSYVEARRLLLEAVRPVGIETVPVSECFGACLAEDLTAGENVPPFDRSSYDGYAFRAVDTENASEDHPVTLRILEEIPAGSVSHMQVTEGTAVKILTGAPIPEGADAVCMYEKTVYTEKTVTLFQPFEAGNNIVAAGEDVRKGTLLAAAGTRIDAGLSGTIAAQNRETVKVFRRPRAGLISTGSELRPVGSDPQPGKIVDSNRYTLAGELRHLGCETVFLGTAADDRDEIASLLEKGLAACDFVVTTGGVSVGDYDLTDAAMEQIGAKILVRGIEMKPGMACAYAVKGEKAIIGLSGNPASSLVNFHVAAAPAVRKMCGLSQDRWIPQTFPVVLESGFKKTSPYDRFLRGKLDLKDGTAKLLLSGNQGNVVLSSMIGSDVMAIVPVGFGPVEKGARLKAFLL